MSETGLNPNGKEGRITAFLRWWGAELLALAPSRLAAFLGLSDESLLLIPQAEGFDVQRLRGGAARPLGPLGESATLAQLSRLRAAGAECVLQLPAEQGLRRQASIAVSALPRGFDAVAGEIERQTPFAPDQVYLGYRVADEVDPRGRVVAHLALAPCARVDDYLQKLKQIDISPHRVCLADDTGANPVGDTVHILEAHRRRPPPRLLLFAVVFALLLALGSPYLRNAVALSKIQAELVAEKQSAAANAQRQRGASDTQSQMDYLAALRGQRPPVTALLDALTRALPDTAYLAQFELSAQTLSLQGVARAASDLIAPLEALPMVRKVEFSAPTLRDPVALLEQFQLTLTLQQAAAARAEQNQ